MEYRRWFILGVVLFAFVLRAPFVFQESIWNDETVYMWLGDSIRENPMFLFSIYPAFHSYGYLIDILVAIGSIFTSSFYASRIITLLVSLVGVALAYIVAEKLTNEWGGLAAGILLAANSQHAFFSVRSLTDMYLATALTFFVYAVINFDGSKKSGIMLGMSSILVVTSRVSGVLTLPFVFLFLVMRAYERKFDKGFFYASGIFSLWSLALLSLNFLLFGNPFKFGNTPLGAAIFGGARSYYIEAAGGLYTLPVFILALVGIYFSFKDRKAGFISASFLTYFLWFSIMVGEKVPRYVLQTIPLAIILSVYGFFKLLKSFDLDDRFVGVVAIFVLLSLPGVTPLISARATTYTGFMELGETLASLDSSYNPNTIYTQSMRQLRAFSGIEFENDGGKIVFLPPTLEELQNQSNVLLQLDVWEYTAPSWAYPLDQDKFNLIQASGFQVVSVVNRNLNGQDIPVGFILYKS